MLFLFEKSFSSYKVETHFHQITTAAVKKKAPSVFFKINIQFLLKQNSIYYIYIVSRNPLKSSRLRMRRTSRVIKHVLYEPPVRKSARIEKGVPEIQKFRAEKDDDNSSEEEGVTKMRIKPGNYNDLHVTKIYKEINEVFVSLTNVTHKRMKRSRTNVSSYYENLR